MYLCFRKERITLNGRSRMLLYQITNAAVQLTELEINHLLQEVNCSEEERKIFGGTINKYRFDNSHIMLKKRHPVLLILDEVRH